MKKQVSCTRQSGSNPDFNAAARILALVCVVCLTACGAKPADKQEIASTTGAAVEAAQPGSQAQKRGEPLKLILASVESGPGAADITQAHVDAALNLNLQLLDGWEYLTLPMRNQALDSLQTIGLTPTAQNIGTALQADALAFVRVDKVQNLLRIDLTLRRGAEYTQQSHGVGWDMIRLRSGLDNSQISDLALTSALQRGLALASQDSLLFKDVEAPFNNMPAAPLVVTSLGIKEDAPSGWDLFNEHIVNSYHAVVGIAEAARKHPSFVTVDIDTRDSMYAMNGFHMVENYRPPSEIEIQTLQFFGIEYVLGGSLTPARDDVNGQPAAEIRLDMAQLLGDRLEPLANVQGLLRHDNRDSLTQRLQELTGQLLTKVAPAGQVKTQK